MENPSGTERRKKEIKGLYSLDFAGLWIMAQMILHVMTSLRWHKKSFSKLSLSEQSYQKPFVHAGFDSDSLMFDCCAELFMILKESWFPVYINKFAADCKQTFPWQKIPVLLNGNH